MSAPARSLADVCAGFQSLDTFLTVTRDLRTAIGDLASQIDRTDDVDAKTTVSLVFDKYITALCECIDISTGVNDHL